MDIAFHYFAVKSLARTAGFTEQDAQIIAKYSQFIDDYNWYVYRPLLNIPDYTNAPELDLVVAPGTFNPATTGFSDFIDYLTLVLHRSQKFTVSPFHFIPRSPNCVRQGDLRAHPCTRADDSYISKMLSVARNDFLVANARDRNFCLMHIGMLLHTFADTHAHQLFTGYHGWENDVTLVQVINNITGKDETKQYQSTISEWLKKLAVISKVVPIIGHMLIEHIPDLTHLTFTMRYKATKTDPGTTYSRSNTQVFVENAGKEALNYLRWCLNRGDVSGAEWNDISKRLARAFLIDISKLSGEAKIVATLSDHWRSVFPNYEYAYSSEEIKKSFISGVIPKATEEFYRYNVFADRLLIELYGSHPRRN